MERIVELLDRWNQQPTKRVTLGTIKMDTALQPRIERIVPFKERSRFEAQREEHLKRLRSVLNGGSSVELDPILLADWGEGLYLVDGHHRVFAYRGCQRREIPARVLEVSKRDAVMVSKLVNTQGVKLPMHAEQAREACWQFIIGMRKQGVTVPANRKLASRFGIDKDTVARMKHTIERVNPRDYNRDFCDETTGWPRWKDARGNAWKGGLEEMEPEKRVRWRAEKLAKKLAGIVADADPEVLGLAIELLKQEARDEQLERNAAVDWQVFLRQPEEDAA